MPDQEPAFAVDLLDFFESDLFLLSDFLLEDLSESPLAKFFLLLDLKSVSYQPLPLNRNPAADTSFFSALALQDGQSINGSSLIFCNAS